MPIRINGVDMPSTVSQPSTDAIGTYKLAANPNLYEGQRTNNYDFFVPAANLTNLVLPGTNGQVIDSNIAREAIRLSNVSCPIPHYTQSALEVRRGNTSFKFAGIPSYSNGTVTFYNYIGIDTLNVLMAWQALSFNPETEKVGLAGDYKKDAYLIEYTPDYQKVRQWILRGCWISSISEDERSSETNNVARIQCTIEYDRGYIDTSDIPVTV